MTAATRKPKWRPTPPPPPSPKVLNLPGRHCRKQSRKHASKQQVSVADSELCQNHRGRLENLFDQERRFARTVPVVLLSSSGGSGESERRVRVEECEGSGTLKEEKWRFQAEILRAECNFLRMEREFAVKKLERNRVQTERTLRSAVQTLLSRREKICEGKRVSAVLEEEIEDLSGRLMELQKSSGVEEFEVRCCSNFDKKASLLQRRLEKLGGLSDEKCLKEIQDIAGASLSPNTSGELDDEGFVSGHKSDNKLIDVEILRRKVEGLSKGMLLERMEEEYGALLSTTANGYSASSANNSNRTEFHHSSSTSIRQLYQESVLDEDKKCSGHCRGIVRRIVEQVRAETEQWSQMQEMLGQVREEMEKLQASRDFWEERALSSNNEIQSLHFTVQGWRQKALSFETKANELQTTVSALNHELENLRATQNKEMTLTQDLAPISLGKQIEKELEKLRIEKNREVTMTKSLPPISLGKQVEKDKHVVICRLTENHHAKDRECNVRATNGCSNGPPVALKRTPFRDIGNSKTIFPLHCSEFSATKHSL